MGSRYMASLRDAFDAMDDDVSALCEDDEDGDGDSEEDDAIDERVPIPSPNTSRNRSIFVPTHKDADGDAQTEIETEAREEDEGDDSDDAEYEEDFEVEMETEMEPEMASSSNCKVSPPCKARAREILRIPGVDASINNFQSKIYSVYSSFDDTLMTHSVASSSDLSNVASPRKV